MSESVEDILARSAEGHTADAVAVAHAELSAVSALLDRLFEAARPEDGFDDWKLIYHAVFGKAQGGTDPIHVRVAEALERVGRVFPGYLDPDEGYRDDVMAWKGSFDEAFQAVARDHGALRAAGADDASGPAAR